MAPYTTGIAEGLAGIGHEVEVFTCVPHYPAWRVTGGAGEGRSLDLVNGVRVTRLRPYIPAVPTLPKRAAFELSFGQKLMTERWQNSDVVICVSPALLSSAMAVIRGKKPCRRRPAMGLWVQDLYSLGLAESRTSGNIAQSSLKYVEARTARRFDGVAVIHDRFASRMAEMGVRPERIRIIRNWTHLRSLTAFDRNKTRKAMGWRNDELVVLHAGAMGEKQGLENVIDAAKCADARGSRVRFVLLGDGSCRRSLETRSKGVNSVQFLDAVGEDLFGHVLRASDVLLVNERPGVSDMAVPSKLTSYMWAGKPIVAATDAASATAEELAAASAGVRVASGAPVELLDAVSRLGADAESARTFGANGRSYCREVLSRSHAIAQFDEWLGQLVQDSVPEA